LKLILKTAHTVNRPYRFAKLASLEVYKWLETGSTHYLKGDVEDCLDSISHDKLMKVLK